MLAACAQDEALARAHLQLHEAVPGALVKGYHCIYSHPVCREHVRLLLCRLKDSGAQPLQPTPEVHQQAGDARDLQTK